MKKMSFSKNYASNIVNIIVLLAGVAMFISAMQIDVGTGPIGAGSEIVPRLMTGIWVVLAVAILIRGLFQEGEGRTGANIKVTAITMGLLLLYASGLRPIGFVISSVLYCFLQMLVFAPSDRRTKRHTIIYAIIAIVAPIGINLLFANVFYVILPRGTMISLPF